MNIHRAASAAGALHEGDHLVKMFCQAFVGRVSLVDVQSTFDVLPMFWWRFIAHAHDGGDAAACKKSIILQCVRAAKPQSGFLQNARRCAISERLERS